MTMIRMLDVAAFAFFLCTIGSFGWASCTKPQLSPREYLKVPIRNIDQEMLGRSITKFTNYFRCQHGRKPLVYDRSLTNSAKLQAANMARLRNLSHKLPVPGQWTVGDRFRIARVKAKNYRAENIAEEFRMAFSNRRFLTEDSSACRFRYMKNHQIVPINSYGTLAERVVENWAGSPGHRALMLSDIVDRIGAAAAFTLKGRAPCGTYYLAQNFAG